MGPPAIWAAVRGIKNALPWKWIGVGLVALALAIAIPKFIDRGFDSAEEKGAAIERSEQFEQTLENVKEASDARDKIAQPGRAGDRVRYDQCLRTARTPANCERWLPDVQAD